MQKEFEIPAMRALAHKVYDAAYAALENALVALRDTSPEHLGYSPEGLLVAARQHEARVEAVKRVMTELDAILTGIEGDRDFVAVSKKIAVPA